MINAAILMATMTVGGMMHGFEVKGVEELPDLSAKLWKLEYAKNGCELVWLECDDENRTFEIVFKTIPEDDSGVAHILEHAVLCGSEKFPSREPFVEMLKSSPHTYLNAFTAKDMTGYPVASRNEKDFLNLTEVYLDAVFHPLTVKSDWSMKQEGWHYEYDGEKLTRNGIVYSEMKGAMSSPHTQMYHDILALLFPDSVYRHNSGGLPSKIPTLTFERYRAFHEKFYHPSNAKIFLYGKVDIDKTLGLIGPVLAYYDRRTDFPEIADQPSVTAEKTVRYASAETKNKTLFCKGWVVCKYDDVEKMVGLSILSELLTGTNFSPLKAPLMKSGLCEDLGLSLADNRQPVLMLYLQNVKDGELATAVSIVRSILTRLVNEGLDQHRIAQLLDKHEFQWRERDTADRGIMLARDVLGTWAYGGDPAQNLRTTEIFSSLRKRLGTNWWAQLLLDSTLRNTHTADLTMIPSATLEEDEAAADEEELKKLAETFTSEQLEAIAAEASSLKARHAAPEDPEILAKLPRLTLKDMPEECEILERTIETNKGVTVIRPKQTLPGFFYLDLSFSMAGFPDEELLDAPMIATLLGELKTGKYDAEALKGEIDGTFGSFSVDTQSFVKGPQLVVRIAALDSHREAALDLVREILLATDYSDKSAIEMFRQQSKSWRENAVRGRAALEYSTRRAAASLSETERVSELLRGIAQLRHLQSGKVGDLNALAKKIFTQKRLTIAVAGNTPEDFIDDVISRFPEGETIAKSETQSAMHAPASEGFVIDGGVAFAALSGKLPDDVPYSGAQQVAAKIISLEHLWPELRVKGGAYGAFFSLGANKTFSFRSYRDPNPAHSYEEYVKAGEKLAEFLDSGASFEKYQVSTLEITDPNFSPRDKMDYVRAQFLNERNPELPRRMRHEIIHATREELRAFAETLKAVAPSGSKCVIGKEELVGDCEVETTERINF